jgi:uncharacterized protein
MSRHLPPAPADGPHLVALDEAECLRLLASRYLGRLAFLSDGRPDVVPVNYVVSDGAVILRLRHGPVSDAVIGAAAAFETDDIDPAYHTGWSVVLHGRAEEIPEADAIHLPLRAWAPGRRERYIRIHGESITGRRIT